MNFVVLILVLGASGIVAQVVLLRELLVAFLSNELTIGLILADWLVLESAGAWLMGRLAAGGRGGRATFAWLTLAFCLAFPASVWLARTFRDWTGIMPGEAPPLHLALLISLAVLLPVSLTHGALFTSAAAVFSAGEKKVARGIGRVYLYETLGTMAGGLVFTWFLVTRFTSFQAALGVSLLNAAACALWLAASRPPARSAAPLVLSSAAAALFAFLLLGSAAGRFQELSVARQWRPQKVVYYGNSVYGNLVVTRREEQTTFFSDGLPALTVPTPDTAAAEEFAHIPLLFHPAPREVMVLGGGVGGVIRELLKQPVGRIDYAELDPLILRTARRFPTPLTEAELNDPRVRVHYLDGRRLVREAGAPLDLILLGPSDPRDLRANRLFTREFFELARGRLREGGILALRLPGSLTYMSRELKDLNACVIGTIEEVFPAVRVIPGDAQNLVLASSSGDILQVDAPLLSRRWEERGIGADFLTPAYFAYRLDPGRLGWFAGEMEGAAGGVNRDFRPLGVYFSLSYWNARFSPAFQRLYGALGRLSLAGVGAAAVLSALALLGWILLSRRPPRAGMCLAMAATGLAGMVFDLVLIFAFQALHGYVFHWVGVLVTAFMAGTAAGSFLMNRAVERMKDGLAVFLRLEAALAAFSLALPAALLVLAPWLEKPGSDLAARAVFILLSVLAGALVGLEFPLAARIYLPLAGGAGEAAGAIYGADLLGGWIGGVAGGAALLPVLGVWRTCAAVALVKLLSLALVAAARARGG